MNRFNLLGVSTLSVLSLAVTMTAIPAFAKHEHKGEDAAVVSDRFVEAQKAKEVADKAFEDITQKLLGGLDHNSSYGVARREAEAAQTAFDSLNDSALASLRNDPKYKAEVAARDKAKAEMDYAHATGQSTDEEKTTLAQAVMTHNAAIHKMEADATKNIGGLSAAKSRAMAAQAKLAQVKAGYMKQVSQDPKWVAAKAAMEESHQKLSEAEVALSKVPDKTRGPIAANPIAANPRNIQPKNIQPVVAQPKVVQPIAKEPVVAQPVAKDPVNAQPVVAQPKNIQPVAKDPVVAQPVAKDPVVAQPVAKDPVVAQPIPGGPPNN